MTSPATLPTLADALGGTADFDAAVVRFEHSSGFVRCAFTGKVQWISPDAPPVNLGRMSEGVEVLVREFRSLVVDGGHE